MNDQEIMRLIEDAETIEEVREVAYKAGIDEATFNTLMEASEKDDKSDELSETELKNVSGGFGPIFWGIFIGRKLSELSRKRYWQGYYEEIMSDERLGGTCENKKK